MPRGKLLNGLVTQQKVLRAAVALFLEKGYTKTTTGEIAKAAGIGQSSFFHVFPSIKPLKDFEISIVYVYGLARKTTYNLH